MKQKLEQVRGVIIFLSDVYAKLHIRKIFKKVSFLLFIGTSSLFGQTSQKVERVKVVYDTKIENYALSLSQILNVGISESNKRNYKIPPKIELRILNTDRVTTYDNGGSIITLEYDTLSRFMPPSCAFFICGEIDKLGSLVFMKTLEIRELKKLNWMNQRFRTSWSVYFASNLIDAIYDKTSDTIWPTQYNFKIHGTENLKRISNDEKSPIYHEINAWIDLGNGIKFDTFTAFFTHFKKGGLSKEAFVKSLYKFMDAEVAKQWEEKYMQYVAL